jgi:hypothetical protein
MLLKTSEVCELARLPVPTLNDWVGEGVIIPAERGGVGRGKEHRYTVIQAVALVVAGDLMRSERGAAPDYVYRAVAGIASMTEETLEEQFRQGWTVLVDVNASDGCPVTFYKPHPARLYDPDVREAYRRVLAYVAERAGRRPVGLFD